MFIYILLILVLILLIYIYNIREQFSVLSSSCSLGKIAEYESNSTPNQCSQTNIDGGLFVETKFHEDYRDVITAFGNIIPPKDHVFNIAMLPLECNQVTGCEIEKLVNQFINLVNTNNKVQVPLNRNSQSGWDEVIPNPNVKSGWGKAMQNIGIPTSLYSDPAEKSDIKLVKILKATKYETVEETKYVARIIVQKMNTPDKMVLSITLIVNNRVNEDDFNKKYLQKDVIIDDVSILGFIYNAPTADLSSKIKCDPKTINKCNKTQLYSEPKAFLSEELSDDYRLMDASTIQDLLMKNYKMHQEEMEHRLATLDHEGRNFYKTLPPVYEYDNIKCTRTIFDDMNEDKVFT